MAYTAGERPGTLNLRGRGEYVNTKVRTSERVVSDQAEPRDYDPLRSDIWNLHKSSYKRMADLSHGEFHSTTRDDLDRVIREKARLPADRSSPLHVVRSFQALDTSLSRQLARLETGALPTHPVDYNQHTFKSTYRASYGHDGREGEQRQPRCQPQQPADKWMAFRRRKSWLFDTERSPTQFTDDALTCPPIPKDVRACVEASKNTDATCRMVDELEMQVAALQNKLDHRRYPAEPNTGPFGDEQSAPRTEPSHPEVPPPGTGDGPAPGTAEKPETTEAPQPVPEPEPTPAPTPPVEPEPEPEPVRAEEPERDRSGEPQHRGPAYSELAVPQRDPQLRACPDNRPGADGEPHPGGGALHPSLPVMQDRQMAGSPDPGCNARGPHPDDRDAGRGQYVRIDDPDYPSAFRLARPCSGKQRDVSGVFPCADTTQCPPPCPPSPPPPCPRTPVPCTHDPTPVPCPPERLPAGRYQSTYTAGYSDPDAGLRQLAAPRSARELYRAPPVPHLRQGTRRCHDSLAWAVKTDVEPAPGPTTAAACVETVGGEEGLSGVPTPGRP